MAWDLHVSGYLLKPVEEDELRDTLSNLHFQFEYEADKLQVHCFGEFSVQFNGQPVKFGRRRSLELLAYLIDARGNPVSSRELRESLWEDIPDEKNGAYLRQLYHDIRKTLKEVGCEDVVTHTYDMYGVDCSKVSCDYYKFLQKDMSAVNSFRGEYMSQFSWADMTLGSLIFGDE